MARFHSRYSTGSFPSIASLWDLRRKVDSLPPDASDLELEGQYILYSPDIKDIPRVMTANDSAAKGRYGIVDQSPWQEGLTLSYYVDGPFQCLKEHGFVLRIRPPNLFFPTQICIKLHDLYKGPHVRNAPKSYKGSALAPRFEYEQDLSDSDLDRFNNGDMSFIKGPMVRYAMQDALGSRRNVLFATKVHRLWCSYFLKSPKSATKIIRFEVALDPICTYHLFKDPSERPWMIPTHTMGHRAIGDFLAQRTIYRGNMPQREHEFKEAQSSPQLSQREKFEAEHRLRSYHEFTTGRFLWAKRTSKGFDGYKAWADYMEEQKRSPCNPQHQRAMSRPVLTPL